MQTHKGGNPVKNCRAELMLTHGTIVKLKAINQVTGALLILLIVSDCRIDRQYVVQKIHV